MFLNKISSVIMILFALSCERADSDAANFGERIPPPITVGDVYNPDQTGENDTDFTKPESELPVVTGDWLDVIVPFGDEQTLRVTTTQYGGVIELESIAATVAIDLNDDGLLDLASGSLQTAPEAVCQSAESFKRCPKQPPQDPESWLDAIAWKRNDTQHVAVLSLLMDDALLSDIALWVSGQGDVPVVPETLLRHYIVERGTWTLAQPVIAIPNELDGMAMFGSLSDIDNDGYLDLVIGLGSSTEAVVFTGGAFGFREAEAGFAPPGTALGGLIIGPSDGVTREAFSLNYGIADIGPSGQPGREPACSIGHAGQWNEVQCPNDLHSSIMGGALVDIGLGKIDLVMSDARREQVVESNNHGKFLSLAGPVGYSAGNRLGIAFDNDGGPGPYRTGWGTWCGSLHGTTDQQCIITNSYENDAGVENWPHPPIYYDVGPTAFVRDQTTAAFNANLNTRRLIVEDMNGDDCPDIVLLPVYQEGEFPSTGIHVLMNGTCEGPTRTVSLVTARGETAFGSTAVARDVNGTITNYYLNAAAGNHPGSATVWVPRDSVVTTDADTLIVLGP